MILKTKHIVKKMAVTNLPVQFCIFCYKSVRGNDYDGNPENRKLCQKFYKNLSSFLKTTPLPVTLPCELVSCKDCEYLITEFCKVYHQMKNLELQLQWKIEILMNVMKSADKVPSRVKALQQSFMTTQNNNKNEPPKSSDKDSNCSGQSKYQLFRQFRQEILNKCGRSRNCFQLQPRVMLKRLNIVDKNIRKTKSEGWNDIPIQSTPSKPNFAIGWLMSFGAVVFLQSLYSDCCYKKKVNYDAITFDTESLCSDDSHLKEPLQNEENNKENCNVVFNYSNEENEDNQLLDRSPLKTDGNCAINITLETESDSSSATSDEDDEEILDVKHDTDFDDNYESCGENTETDINHKPSFLCKVCNITFNSKRSLLAHTKRRHPASKRGPSRINSTFPCAFCKTSYKTYQLLRRHKTSAIHRFFEKKSHDKSLKLTNNIKSEDNPTGLTEFVRNEEETSQESNIRDNPNETLDETSSAPYNLRLRLRKKLYNLPIDQDDELNSNNDNNYLQDSDSANTSSSGESDLKDNEKISPSRQNNNENEEKSESTIESSQYYRCLLDDCEFKQVVFSQKSRLDQHKYLHTRGQYSCNFCEKIEETPIKLSLHETEMHSSIPSTSTNLRGSDSIYYCARCPYETQKEGIYFKHFASVHLEIFANERVSWECEICKKKFVKGKTRRETHFKTHHDTKGIEDPDTQIKKCTENNCSAYFLTSEQLRVHKVMQHSSSNSRNELDKLVNDMIEMNDETRFYKCLFCMKERKSFFSIRNHVRTFHYQMLTDQTRRSGRTRNGKWLICPEVKCTKTFKTNKGLEIHQKFHGQFGCLFCDKIYDYATDLAKHENKLHSHFTNAQQNQRCKFKCSRCPCTFRIESNYMRHFVNEHLGVSTIHSVCTICQFECHSETLQVHHLRNHYTDGMDPEKIQRCSKCPAFFRTYSQLYCHMEKSHQDPTKPKKRIYKCEMCNSTFKSPPALEIHLNKEHPNTNISNKFKCTKCKRHFCRAVGLKIHMIQMHTAKIKDNVNLPHMCFLDRCKRRFKDAKSLKLHQNLHERGIFPCKFCDAVVNSIMKLSMHEYLKHSDRKGKNSKGGSYNCSRCNYKNTLAIRYQNHFAQTHMGIMTKSKSALNEKLFGKFKCNFCETETKSALELGYHEADHVNKKTKSDNSVKPKIQCPRCPKSYIKQFYIKHYLTVHFDGSTKTRQTICLICKEKATQPKRHFRKYHKTDDLEDPLNIYKCEGEEDSCKAYFIKYDQLVQHKKIRHPVNEWKCKECEKIYKTEKSFKMHQRDYHLNVLKNPGLNFLCDVANCKRGFDTKDELVRHKKWGRCKLKSGENMKDKIKCDQCHRKFSTKTQLQSHMSSVHSNPLFVCQECGKAFKTKGNLQMHLEYHKGPDFWKFQCSTCGKKCVSKNVLNTHLRTHTGEKPYVCQYCGEKYSHIHNWKNHMLTKHKNEDDLPNVRKTPSKNRLSRKGTKKRDCIISEVTQ